MKVKVKNKYVSKFNNSVYEIYNVRNNQNGFPCFLIYEKNQWHYFSAKFFAPVTYPYISLT